MLNPSTADAVEDDPTIRSCVRLCAARGLSGFEVVNLFALRATDPRELARYAAPVGPDNDAAILRAVRDSSIIVCAWGANPAAERRAPTVLEMIRAEVPRALCWGRTASGAPRHPLFLATATPLETFTATQSQPEGD